MQFFHQRVKRNGRKIARSSIDSETAGKRATLDVAPDSWGWYKVRAAIDLQHNGCADRGVTKLRLRIKNSELIRFV